MCLSLGAEKWIDFQDAGDKLIQEVMAATDGGPHVAIVTASNVGSIVTRVLWTFLFTVHLVAKGAAYNQAVMYLRTLGTLMCVGLPQASLNVPIPVIAVKVNSLASAHCMSTTLTIDSCDKKGSHDPRMFRRVSTSEPLVEKPATFRSF